MPCGKFILRFTRETRALTLLKVPRAAWPAANRLLSWARQATGRAIQSGRSSWTATESKFLPSHVVRLHLLGDYQGADYTQLKSSISRSLVSTGC